jgi:hypothetical protein
MSNPTSRLTRLPGEDGRFPLPQPGQTSIDVTPDVVAMLGGFKSQSNGVTSLGEKRNLLETNDLGWDVPTRVQFV